MNEHRKLQWKTAMNHGLLIGLVLIIMALLVWFASLEQASWLRLINWAIYVGAIYLSTKNWRDQYNGGVIKYNQALGHGVLVMFFASLVFALYTVIYANFLDPESITRALDMLEENYYNKGFTEAQIEQFLDLAGRMQTPVIQAISSIFGTTFIGFLVSLIVSFFVKREGDPFNSAMKNIQEAEEVQD